MDLEFELNRSYAKPNKTIKAHTDDLLNNLDTLKKLGYISDEEVYNLVRLACTYHDYGKVNSEFQNRVTSKNKIKFNVNTEVAHNVLSLYFVDKNYFKSSEDFNVVGYAVLNHHDYCDGLQIMKEKKELINSLLKDFKTFNPRLNTNNTEEIITSKKAVMVKGLLHKCDYSASGDIKIEYENNFLSNGLENLCNQWKKQNADAQWNELQLFCKEHTNDNIMVVAPTGMGKTEAGLHWIGNNKGFFILPLRTAINAIYDRISQAILENTLLNERVALLHSDTLSYYNNHNPDEDDSVVIFDYYNKSRQLSLPLTVATLDQLFNFVLKYQGYELKLATLSYSKIVIDEIQMYDAQLLAYLICGIQKIIEFGGKVAILTATLPPFISDLLSDIKVQKTFTTNQIRHNLKIIDSTLNPQDILDHYNKFGGKILVVCNSVKKAQELYVELSEECVTNILHSKFIKKHRREKEGQIKAFGNTNVTGTGIWVCTQIVEASLDIDFDYLFTELSDLSGLFQRLGRCNRKGVKPIDTTNCFVYLHTDKWLLKTKTNRKGFIDETIYNLSVDAIKNTDGAISEQQKIDLINIYLTSKNMNGSVYMNEYRCTARKLSELYPYEIEKKDSQIRNIQSFDVIPISIYTENKSHIDTLVSDIEKPTLSLKEKINIKEALHEYTVPVSRYAFDNNTSKTLKIDKYFTPKIVNCTYTEVGYQKIDFNSPDNIQNDLYDNFI